MEWLAKLIAEAGPYGAILVVLLSGIGICVRYLAGWLRPQVDRVVDSHLQLVSSLQNNDVKQTQILDEQQQILRNHSETLAEHSKTLAHHGVVLHEIASQVGKNKQ